MNGYLAVFKSRSQAIDCYNKLTARFVPVKLVNTPKEARSGCGLSVAFPAGASSRVKRLIAQEGYSSFYGYLKYDGRGVFNAKRL